VKGKVELSLRGRALQVLARRELSRAEGELEAARAVWQRKFASPPQDQKEKAKQVRFLQSRGFSMEVILNVMKLSNFAEDESF